MDAVPLAMDVAAHGRIPASGLVSEMDAGFEQLFDAGFGSRFSHSVPLSSVRFRSGGAVAGTRRDVPGRARGHFGDRFGETAILVTAPGAAPGVVTPLGRGRGPARDRPAARSRTRAPRRRSDDRTPGDGNAGIGARGRSHRAGGRSVLTGRRDRTADRLQMGADLMGPAGLQLDRRAGRRGQSFADLEMGHRGTRSPPAHDDALGSAMVAAQRSVDPSGSRRRAALDQGEVLPRHLASRDHLAQGPVGVRLPCDDEQAGCVACRAGARSPAVRASSPPPGEIPELLDQRRPRDFPAPDGRSVPAACRSLPGARRPRRSTSRRSPGFRLGAWRFALLGTVGVRRAGLGSERVHPDENHDAERDRNVGDVERRPGSDRSTKSVTAPSRIRSIRLPTAPPASRPIGSQSPRRSEEARNIPRRRRRRPQRGSGRPIPLRRGGRMRSRRLATRTISTPATTSICSPGAT